STISRAATACSSLERRYDQRAVVAEAAVATLLHDCFKLVRIRVAAMKLRSQRPRELLNRVHRDFGGAAIVLRGQLEAEWQGGLQVQQRQARPVDLPRALMLALPPQVPAFSRALGG